MYKNKKIAIIFFARSNSKRLKNKLFKKIFKSTVLSHSINITNNLKIVDDRIMATTSRKEDNKIVDLAKNKGLKIYRGSENNVLERMFFAYKSINPKPDILIRFCCENPATSSEIIKKYLKIVINKKIDLMSVVKPSNLLFGIAPIILSSPALEKIYKNAKNKIYKEHVETYCYDNNKSFKIDYIRESENFFFPDTSLSIDTIEDYERIKSLFKISKIKNYNFDYKKIVKSHSKNKIYIKNLELRKYLIKNYKNFSYSKDIKTANIVIDTDLKNFLKKNGKLYLILKKRNKNMIFSFVKNGQYHNLIQIKKNLNLSDLDYVKLFFSTLIKKTFFWPPLPLDDLTINSNYDKILKNNLYRKINDYFPKEIISNKNIPIKNFLVKKKVVNDFKFKKMIKNENKKLYKSKMFIYNDYFVYMNGLKLTKITKFDILKIVTIWRSHKYSI